MFLVRYFNKLAMVYSMAEACQDYLKENNVKSLSMHEEMMKRNGPTEGEGEEGEGEDDDDEGPNEEEEWRGLADKEKCPESERVTSAQFLAWRITFEAEMIACGVLKKPEEKMRTGQMIFMEARKDEESKVGAKTGTNAGAADGAPLVYDASLFGEVDDDLDDISGGEDE